MRNSTRQGKPDGIKTVRPKRGRTYYYFDTGQVTPRGTKIYASLPDKSDPSFWTVYAALKSARTLRQSLAPQLMLTGLIDLYQKSQRWRKLSKGTQRLYEIYLRNLAHQLNTAPADEVARKDMIRLVDAMADRPGAANLQLRTASALYAWGRSRGHVTAHPCDDIDLFEIGEHQPWPQALIEAGLEADDELVRVAVHLLYFTGQRIGDVCAMRWSDFAEGRIDIVQEKTGTRISIPPHPALGQLLARMPKAGLTIIALDGKRVDRQTVRGRLQRWAAKLGHDIVPHGLRKNAVNALLESGCSAAETASITGQSLGLVEKYAKARDGRRLADAAILKWSRDI
jgi:integrase